VLESEREDDMTQDIQVEVDQELCYGAQNCSLAAPSGFEYDDDGKAQVPDSPRATVDQYREAEEQCPAMAIKVRVAGRES
jgi:ferredoxin